jgi:hypothetical protein
MGLAKSKLLIALDAKMDQALVVLNKILAQGVKEMAAIDDLNAAVATLAANFTTLDTAVQAEITALTAALAAGNTAAVSAAAANIAAVSSKMAADAASLTSSLPPVTPPVA